MGKAICSDISFVQREFGKPGCCTPDVFRSVWDRLCKQLFGAMPVGMDAGSQLPNIEIWKDGVSRQGDTEPYTFVVASDGTDAPKASDIIYYKGKYYIIGAVE